VFGDRIARVDTSANNLQSILVFIMRGSAQASAGAVGQVRRLFVRFSALQQLALKLFSA
jgi:hypothetical protein